APRLPQRLVRRRARVERLVQRGGVDGLQLGQGHDGQAFVPQPRAADHIAVQEQANDLTPPVRQELACGRPSRDDHSPARAPKAEGVWYFCARSVGSKIPNAVLDGLKVVRIKSLV